MGGGVRSSCSFSSSPDDHSSIEDDKSHGSSDVLEFEPFEIRSGFDSGEFDLTSYKGNSSNHLPISENLRRRLAQEANIIKSYSYGDSIAQTESLNEAKRLLLSYTPGSWIDKDEGERLSDFDVPKATTLLVVGFKGSGKSSLINRISRLFEDKKFASDRAQVSYSSSLGDGTKFLHGYMTPRRSSSICLFDTRSLSDETRDNDDMIKSWMTNGVRNGKLVIRESDNQCLRDTLKCKIRDGNMVSEPIRKVNFVIFTVDGLSVLRSMNSDTEEDTRCAQMLARTYNSPYLSFGDDKPVIVVTKGDLLSHEERARVRIYLGELLGAPPATQIFDIPESRDPCTELATLEMLKYALEHADKNLPHKSCTCRDLSSDNRSSREVYTSYIISLIIMGLGVTMASILGCQPLSHCAPLSNSPVHLVHDHERLVNQTVDHPAEPQINSTAQTASFCNHHCKDSETTRETDQTANLDLSNSSTQSNSEPTRATSTGQEQQTLVKPEQQTPVKPKQQTPQRPVKSEQKTPQRPVKTKQQTPVKPKTRKTECKLRAHKQQKAEDASDPKTNWEARKRLWLEDEDPTINWEARKRLWLEE